MSLLSSIWWGIKSLACGLLVAISPNMTNRKIITVFIHGTVFPELALLNPINTYTDTICQDDWYTQTLKSLRSNSVLHQDSIILNTGLQEIPSNIIQKYVKQNLSPSLSKIAAYQASGAYQHINNHLNRISSDYYTFGSLGLLSDKYRAQSGLDLYNELIRIRDGYINNGYDPEFHLLAYSHGGNIALYLAQAEDQDKKNLSIDTLVLWGTPIQEQTVKFAEHPLFKKIINIYSEGDNIQVETVFSTLGISHRKFKDLIDTSAIMQKTGKIIHDLRIAANDNYNAFGHYPFWHFDRYTSSLWQDTKTQEVFNVLNPLPLAILSPLILELLNKVESKSAHFPVLDLILKTNNNRFKLKLVDPETKQCIARSEDISSIISKIQDYAIRSWMPHATSSETLKNGLSLWTVVQTLSS